MQTKSQRAKPLSPEERRQSIVDALIPLLMEKGSAVTTAEIAEAAGIAEGTIFRAFPDKATLLHEAIKTTMNPLPVRDTLRRIPPDAPLETQLLEAARALAGYFERITALIGMLRGMPHPVGHQTGGPRPYALESLNAITGDLASVIANHRNRLFVEPAQVAIALRGLVFVNTHPFFAKGDRLTIEEIVTVLLNGVLTRDSTTTEVAVERRAGVPIADTEVT